MYQFIQKWPRRFRFEGDIISGQSAGCAVSVQVRYTRYLWFPQWAQGRKSAFLNVGLFVPRHDPDKGYRCIGFNLSINNLRIIKRRRSK
jgi:hypothetical protein